MYSNIKTDLFVKRRNGKLEVVLRMKKLDRFNNLIPNTLEITKSLNKKNSEDENKTNSRLLITATWGSTN